MAKLENQVKPSELHYSRYLDCPICKSPRVRSSFVRKGILYSQCESCGLIYQDPPPAPEITRAFYEDSYYQSLGDLKGFIQHARLPLYENFLSEFENFRRTGRLLDIGCGHGDFLKMAKDAGWEVWGIEPSREAAEIARNLLRDQVLNETTETADLPKDYFDIITLWNVLDCLPDPRQALEKINQWLSPGGLLVIRTPNAAFHAPLFRFWSVGHGVLERLGWKKEASVFLRFNFKAKTLKRFLQNEGYSHVRISNGEPTGGDPYQVLSNSRWMQMSKNFVYFLARVIAFVSGNRFMIGTNLIIRASKPHPEIRQTSPDRRFKIRMLLKKIMLCILASAGYLTGMPIWARLFGKHREIRILLYHSVNPGEAGDMNISPAKFKEQMNFLIKHYEVISLDQAVGFLKEGKLPERPVVAVTFDDGYEDNYQVAYPVLKRKKIPATIFLLTGGNGHERRSSHLGGWFSQEQALLKWDQIREMADGGVTFGSHGETHSRLKGMSAGNQLSEIASSRQKIESETGQTVSFFSYPYGTRDDFDTETETLVSKAGYKAAFSAIGGTNGKKSGLFSVKRIGIEASDNLFTFRAKLNGALSFLAFFKCSPVRRMVRWCDSVFLKRKPAKEVLEDPILLVSVDFPPHTDGVSTISREMAIRIGLQGKPVFVIGPKDQGDWEFDDGKPFRAFRVPGYDWGYFRFVPILFSMPWIVLRHRLRKVFAMNIAYGGIVSWLVSFVLPLEYVLFAYGYEFEKVKQRSLAKKLYEKIYARAKTVICCSQEVHRRLISFGVNPGKIKVLYPGVDGVRYRRLTVPEEFPEKNQLMGRRVLLTVGRLVERKGHDQVLEALPTIIREFPDVLYVIVGKGDYEEVLRRKVRELDLENHVRFMGWVTGDDILYLYNTCEVFIMPSREIKEGGHLEGFGIVYLEANACGKPVVGGKSGGVVEAIQDGKTGFLVDPLSPDEIAEKVIFLLLHPEKAKEMGEAAADWVRDTFNWEDYVRESYRMLMDKDLT